MTVPRKGISTASAKSKGRKLQQLVRDELLKIYPEFTLEDIVSCPMSQTGADIKFSQAAKAKIPFDFECKRRAKIGLIYDALAQAKRSVDRLPVAVVQADRKRPLVVIDLDIFMALISP